jgi:hypothetical protein
VLAIWWQLRLPEEMPVSDQPPTGTRTLIVGGTIIVALGAAWFGLSHFVMDTGVGDALGEALGVVLALAVVASIVGAIWSSRGKPG